MGQSFKTVACHRDLLAIGEHIGQRNLTAALKMLDTIDAKLQFLADNPMLGEARPELAPELRSFSVGSYVIYFLPCPEGITAVRVLHGAQDVGIEF
jgi:toxin ParE1/3/4